LFERSIKVVQPKKWVWLLLTVLTIYCYLALPFLREYHKTRDILHVMTILGHRKIDTTYRYVRLYNQIYKPKQANKFITKIASTKEERIALKNDGWTCWEKDGNDWYFSKPKLS